MKLKKSHKIGFGILILVVSLLYLFGIKHPPEKLKSTELSIIKTVAVNNGKAQNLTNVEVEFWKKLEFEISTENYPGETPDYVIKLSGIINDFTAMYNKNSGTVFFIFFPEIEYGFLNSPSPGGWNKPIYETQANEKLLELLRIK